MVFTAFLFAIFYTLFLAVNALPTSLLDRASGGDISQFLQSHNDVRAQHGASALKWSEDLAGKAQGWISQCKLEHYSGNKPVGENIAAATGDFSINDAVNLFVSDKDQYKPWAPVYNHFTQVVWKGASEMGCATQKCEGMMDGKAATIHACIYDIGNVIGQLKENVQL